MPIVSFDGSIDTLYSISQLTTMQQDTRAVARHAVAAALDPDNVPDATLIDPKLVIGRSCGCR